MPTTFSPLPNGQVQVYKDGRNMGTYSSADGQKYFGTASRPSAGTIAPSNEPTMNLLGNRGSAGTLAPDTAPKMNLMQTPQQQAAEIKAKLADLQAQQAALAKYGVNDTNLLTRNASGEYVLKPSVINTDTTAGGVQNAQNIAANKPTAAYAYKNSAAYQALSAEAKNFVDLGYDTISVGSELEAQQLSDAIAHAVGVAEPYYRAQLILALGEIQGAIARQKGDYETKYRIIKATRDRIAEDVSIQSGNLTLEQQSDLSKIVRGFDEDLLAIADTASEKGLAFATGARSKILADERRREEYQDVVQSSKREYNYKINELRTKASRGDEDAAAELADLEKGNTLALQKIGRTAETVLGSANMPNVPGYVAGGGVIGSIEEDKRKSILSDVTGMMQLQKGF